jgi:hypothetical protein
MADIDKHTMKVRNVGELLYYLKDLHPDTILAYYHEESGMANLAIELSYGDDKVSLVTFQNDGEFYEKETK